VLTDNGSILIEPVDPNVMYVPQYDPNQVYYSAYPESFGPGYPIGLWCDNQFDWHRHFLETGGGWYSGWHHPAEWDRNPPAWNHRPAGSVGTAKPWVRTGSRPAPRLTSAGVARLGLDRPHGATGVTPAAGAARRGPAPLQIGRQPEAQPSRNAFDPNPSRAQVQDAVQRARPAPVQPARVPSQSPPRPAAAVPAQRAPARAAPAPQRSAPSNVFRGGSGGATRAQSTRGNASRHR
jgi:hypothetical protein